MSLRFWVSVAVAVLVLLAGIGVRYTVEHRHAPSGPPAVVHLGWVYDRDEPDRMPLPPGVTGFDPHGPVTTVAQRGEMFPPMKDPWPSYLVDRIGGGS